MTSDLNIELLVILEKKEQDLEDVKWTPTGIERSNPLIRPSQASLPPSPLYYI